MFNFDQNLFNFNAYVQGQGSRIEIIINNYNQQQVKKFYRVCHGFILTKLDDYFCDNFEHF